MAPPISFFNFKTIHRCLGDFHLGGNNGTGAIYLLSIMGKISSSRGHAVEPGNRNHCHALYLELGLCPASANLDIYICTGGLEAKDDSPILVCHRMDSNRTCAIAGGQSKSIFLVGTPMAPWRSGAGHRLEFKI